MDTARDVDAPEPVLGLADGLPDTLRVSLEALGPALH
ncbi:hypothetical protein OKW38_000560 [Paraburkholderia sp. MM5496-R1]|nr:hypothetical protein [Paraburkholderia sp. MM5384-R2]